MVFREMGHFFTVSSLFCAVKNIPSADLVRLSLLEEQGAGKQTGSCSRHGISRKIQNPPPRLHGEIDLTSTESHIPYLHQIMKDRKLFR